MSQRNRKTTKTQMELILNFLGQNNVLITGKTHPLHPTGLDEKWEELTALLNSVENGARKDKKQWKTFLYEWKSKTKKKARLNHTAIIQTGGGGYICKDLTDLGNRLMAIFGWIHVIGCPGAPAEVDPDAELLENVIIEELLIENECEVPVPETDLQNETSEPEISEIPIRDLPFRKSSGAIPKIVHKKKKINSSSKLEHSAILYSESTGQMAVAVNEMAVAVKEIAAAISQLAGAISNIASALHKESN